MAAGRHRRRGATHPELSREAPAIVLGLMSMAACCLAADGSASLAEEQRASQLARSEELILELSPALGQLGKALELGGVINPKTRGSFADRVTLRPILAAGDAVPLQGSQVEEITTRSWPIATQTTSISADQLVIWQAFFSSLGIPSLDHAAFHLVRGEFSGDREERFVTTVSFDGLAQLASGPLISIESTQQMIWQRPGEETGWQISGWHMVSFETVHTPSPLFSEVLDTAIPDRASLAHARRSRHEENVIELFTKDRFQVNSSNKLYAKYTDIEGLFQHPSLAVIDIDRDGHDDLYVMARWGRNQLLRNRGDGTFEDIAPEIGLDIDSFCNCAIFADFDNDGDPDAFIGRSLERGLYLENQDGQFTDRSRDLVGSPMPYLISSISAADYNGDGLLDVYLSLYGPSSRTHSAKTWAPDFFPPQMVAAMEKREQDAHTYLNRFGPPNLLLVNRGGKFAVAPEAAQLAEWLNTFQCSWADYDDDGDQDAYICNDFAPDHLYRNDGSGADGTVKFTEVSRQVAGDTMQGFGMGASWGDYDGDSKLDLYVSNMYSKAGQRITAAFEGLDQRLAYSARGSLLFRNGGDRFEQVAGTGADDIHVAKVGWSWGGQFTDLDNDGWLDIYAASGFYTAPEELAPQVDL